MTDKVPELETKRVDQLERGDWIHCDFEDFIDVARVVHVETYPSDSWGVGAILLYSAVGDPSIHTARFAATDPIRLLFEAEVGQAVEDERRELIASEFQRLADLFRRAGTPLPSVWRPISVEVELDDVAAAEAMAGEIGARIDEFDKGTFRAIESRDSDFGAGLYVHWMARRPKGQAPADPTGLAYTRADDEPDDPKPVSGGRVAPHTGGMTNGGLVDESEPSPPSCSGSNGWVQADCGRGDKHEAH